MASLIQVRTDPASDQVHVPPPVPSFKGVRSSELVAGRGHGNCHLWWHLKLLNFSFATSPWSQIQLVSAGPPQPWGKRTARGSQLHSLTSTPWDCSSWPLFPHPLQVPAHMGDSTADCAGTGMLGSEE
jgi:hypothetical protein